MPDTGGGTTTQVTKTEPPAYVKPYITGDPSKGIVGVLPEAQKQYESSKPAYFPTSTVADFSPAQDAALQALIARGAQGSPLESQAQGNAFATLGGDYLGANPGNPTYSFLAGGANGLGPGADFYNLGGTGTNSAIGGYDLFARGGVRNGAADPWLTQVSTGGGPISSMVGDIASGGGLDLTNIANDVMSKVKPSIDAMYSAAGRSPGGAGDYGGTLTRAFTESFAPTALAAAQQNVANRLNASNLIQQGYDTGQSRALSAGNLAGGFSAQDIANRLAALGGQGSLTEAGYNRALQAGQGLTGAYGQELGAMGTGAAGLSGSYDAERARQMQALGLTPDLAGMDYTDINAVLGAGGAQQGQAQQELTDLVNRWNFGQNIDQQKLNNLISAVYGAPGASTYSSGSQPSNAAGSALGGIASLLPLLLLAA